MRFEIEFKSIEQKAKQWVRKNKSIILDQFVSTTKFPPAETPLTFFMAGSPGAGKTEASVQLQKYLKTIKIDKRI